MDGQCFVAIQDLLGDGLDVGFDPRLTRSSTAWLILPQSSSTSTSTRAVAIAVWGADSSQALAATVGPLVE